MDIHDKSIPASVRFRNIGAIGASNATHEHQFGAFTAQELPASDGSKLSTPVFKHIRGGAAYWGHWVARRAAFNGSTTLRTILDKYRTGHAEQYLASVVMDTGIDPDRALSLVGNHPELFHIMVAMGRWEAAARKEHSPGYKYFECVYGSEEQRNQLYGGMIQGISVAIDQGYGGFVITKSEPPNGTQIEAIEVTKLPEGVEVTTSELDSLKGYRDKVFAIITASGVSGGAILTQLQDVPFWAWGLAGAFIGYNMAKFLEHRRTKEARRKNEMAEFLAWKKRQ